MLPLWAWILIAVLVLLLIVLIVGVVMSRKQFDEKKCYADRRKEWTPEYVQDIIRLGFLKDRIKLNSANSEYLEALQALNKESKNGKCNEWFVKKLMDKGKFVSQASTGFGNVAQITVELANDALRELDKEYAYVDATKRELPKRERALFANPAFMPETFRKALEVKPFEAEFLDVPTPRALTARQIIDPTKVVRKIKKAKVPSMRAGETNEFSDIEEEVVALTPTQIENFDKVVDAIQHNIPADVAVQQVQAQLPPDTDPAWWDGLYDYILEKVIGTSGAV